MIHHMKNPYTRSAALALLALALLCAPPARAQYNYQISGPTALLSNTWASPKAASGNVDATNAIASGVPIKLNTGFGLLTHYTCGQDSNTVSYSVYFNTSPDGVNWTTDPTFYVTFKGRGTTNSMSFTQVPVTTAGAVRYIRPQSLQIPGAGTNEFYITNMYVYYPY
jgi:hypothetical protein